MAEWSKALPLTSPASCFSLHIHFFYSSKILGTTKYNTPPPLSIAIVIVTPCISKTFEPDSLFSIMYLDIGKSYLMNSLNGSSRPGYFTSS